jgi:hypothetical protein
VAKYDEFFSDKGSQVLTQPYENQGLHGHIRTNIKISVS